jgi:hypothetical protein
MGMLDFASADGIKSSTQASFGIFVEDHNQTHGVTFYKRKNCFKINVKPVTNVRFV